MIHPWLIDTETLHQNLGRGGLVIVDVRGRAAYEFGGHIPGAVHSTWHEYSDPSAVAKGLLDSGSVPDRAEAPRIGYRQRQRRGHLFESVRQLGGRRPGCSGCCNTSAIRNSKSWMEDG
ncbi:MAG: hypothetical protein KatS3mg082_2334 [Nitrospiraceae bacterium]|nr:MAG: hypothetical protein KatS3mg082_2334 [Nitrospiraceae bacterium]